MTHNERTDAIRAYLRQCAQDGRLSPTLREIGAAVGLSAASAVSHHIDKLCAEGFCNRDSVGRIVLAKREPVAVLRVVAMSSATVIDDQGSTFSFRSANLTLGRPYRVEVYRAE